MQCRPDERSVARAGAHHDVADTGGGQALHEQPRPGGRALRSRVDSQHRKQRLELEPRLGVLARGVGVAHDAGARVQVGARAFEQTPSAELRQTVRRRRHRSSRPVPRTSLAARVRARRSSAGPRRVGTPPTAGVGCRRLDQLEHMPCGARAAPTDRRAEVQHVLRARGSPAGRDSRSVLHSGGEGPRRSRARRAGARRGPCGCSSRSAACSRAPGADRTGQGLRFDAEPALVDQTLRRCAEEGPRAHAECEAGAAGRLLRKPHQERSRVGRRIQLEQRPPRSHDLFEAARTDVVRRLLRPPPRTRRAAPDRAKPAPDSGDGRTRGGAESNRHSRSS